MPDSTRPIGCTCFALRKLTRTVTRLYDHHLAAAGIRTTQFSLLKWISQSPMPMATLAKRMKTERTTLTRNLKPLLDAGWVVIKPGDDARQKIVHLTAAGRKVIDAGEHAWRVAQSRLEEALGLDAVRDLHLQLDTALRVLAPLLEQTLEESDD